MDKTNLTDPKTSEYAWSLVLEIVFTDSSMIGHLASWFILTLHHRVEALLSTRGTKKTLPMFNYKMMLRSPYSNIKEQNMQGTNWSYRSSIISQCHIEGLWGKCPLH